MPEMNITVRNKIATKTDNMAYVCGNSDYVINFAFDGEWDAYDTKTARFARDGQYTDVVFTGNQCNVPVITNTYAFHVGVFAGDLHTTTAARVPCRKCILCGSGAPADPTPDVYDQLMARMAQLETSDWAQNDPTAKDYVRNRTHWVEINKSEYTGLSGVVIATDYMQTPIPEIWINGVKYTDIPVNHSDSDSRVSWYIVGQYRIDLRLTSGGVISSITPEVDETKIIVYRYDEIVHKLPDKFIPNWVANVSDIPDVPKQVQADWDETSINSKAYIRNKPNLSDITVYRDNLGLSATSYTLRGLRMNIMFYTAGKQVPLLPAEYLGDQYTILSTKTGQPLTEEECPYGAIMLMFGRNEVYCLNPR